LKSSVVLLYGSSAELLQNQFLPEMQIWLIKAGIHQFFLKSLSVSYLEFTSSRFDAEPLLETMSRHLHAHVETFVLSKYLAV
jgi:hypothetical protein